QWGPLSDFKYANSTQTLLVLLPFEQPGDNMLGFIPSCTALRGVGFAASALLTAFIASVASAQVPAALTDLVFHPAPLPQQIPAAARSRSVPNPRLLLALGETTGAQVGEHLDYPGVPGLSGLSGVESPLNRLPGTSATDQYLQAIAQLEATESPFSPALFQNLLSLGTLYQQQQEHARAVDV